MPNRLIVSLEYVDFLDPGGAAALVEVGRRACTAGTDFVLASVPPVVRPTLELPGSIRIFCVLEPRVCADWRPSDSFGNYANDSSKYHLL